MKRTRLILFSIGLVILGILFLGVTGTVSAAPVTFDFTFSGAGFGNTAIATGFISAADVTNIPNPSSGSVAVSLPDPAVLALSITVSGANIGNGTFGLADFEGLYWDTGGATLDFTKELVGQPIVGGQWGITGGDFNLFALEIDPLPDPAAPTGVIFFTLETNSGEGDLMQLTSMKAREVGAVPEPATMLLLGSGLIGLAGYGRKKLFKK